MGVLGTTPRAFSEDDLAALRATADRVMTAVEAHRDHGIVTLTARRIASAASEAPRQMFLAPIGHQLGSRR